MAKFIRYTNEFIQSLRPDKDEVISEKLSKHFDVINELFFIGKANATVPSMCVFMSDAMQTISLSSVFYLNVCK